LKNKFNLCLGYEDKKLTKPLIFYHVPKCGGTTVCNLLLNFFQKKIRLSGSPTNERNTTSSIEYFNKNIEEIMNKNYSFIFGHFQHSISKYFPNYLSATVLRDPIDRVLSHYNYIVEKKYIDKNVTLEQAMQNFAIPSNIIVQMFSCKDNTDRTIDTNKMEKALRTLKKDIDFIYDSKDINKLLNKLISIYDFPNLFFENMQITSKKTLYRNNENIDLIKKYNKYDIELYNNLKNANIFQNDNNEIKRRNKDEYFINSSSIHINKKYQILVNKNHFNKIIPILINNGTSILQ